MRKILHHNELGDIIVTFKSNARSFIARWNSNTLMVTAPAMASDADVQSALNRLLPRILAAKSRDVQFVKYYENQEIKLDGLLIVIKRQHLHRDSILIKQNSIESVTIAVGDGLDFDDIKTSQFISKALKRIARKNAARILLPRARQLAETLHCNPSAWEISSGSRILGQCSSTRCIKLSYMLIFLPQDLRDYIICHELAHLSEFNHSSRFHEICNIFLEGKEKELIKKLKIIIHY
mgnify:CR=1 FL=1